MRASKENAAKALQHLIFISDALPNHVRQLLAARLLFIDDLLMAAQKKLPHDASFDKDRIRKHA